MIFMVNPRFKVIFIRERLLLSKTPPFFGLKTVLVCACGCDETVSTRELRCTERLRLSLVEAQARAPLTRIRGAQAPRTGIMHFRFWLKKIRGRGMARAGCTVFEGGINPQREAGRAPK